MLNGLAGENLFHAGIAIMAAALLLAAVSAFLLHRARKKLNRQLDAEYGKKRH